MATRREEERRRRDFTVAWKLKEKFWIQGVVPISITPAQVKNLLFTIIPHGPNRSGEHNSFNIF